MPKFAIDAIFRAIDQISNPVTRMAAKVSRSAGRMEKSLGGVNKALRTIKSGAGLVGGAVVKATAVAAAGLTAIISKGATVEDTLVGAASKFQEPIERGTKAFDELAESALRVSGATEFGANESANALKFMAKAGETAGVSMQSLRTFADLATVAETDLATAADFASDAVGPLGFATEDLTKKSAAYTKTADKMAKTANIANLDFSQLFESIKSGSKRFLSAGQSADQFLSIISVLAGEGIKGGKAGMDIARAIGRITNKATKAPKALRKLGVSITEGFGKNKKVRDFLDIMTDLDRVLAKKSQPVGLQALTDIFGEDSATAGEIILDNLDKIRKNQKKIADAEDFVAQSATARRNTTLGEIKTFWSTVESIVVEVFFIIRDDVVMITKEMTKWARANKAVFSANVVKGLQFMRDNFDHLVELGPGFAIFVGTLWTLSSALAAVQGVLSIVALTTTVTGATIGLTVFAVVALIAALGIIIILWDEVVEVMEESVSGAIERLTGFWNDLTEGVKAGEPAWIAIGAAMLPIAAIIAGTMLPVIGLIVGVKLLMKAWDVLPKFFSDTWDQVTESFLKADRALDRAIAGMKKTINDLTGSEIFDASATVVIAPVPPPVVAVPPPNLGDFGPIPGLPTVPQPANGQPPAPPQVVNTTSMEIARSVTEIMRTLKLDINLKDPAGAVESIEQGDLDDTVRVTKTGTL